MFRYLFFGYQIIFCKKRKNEFSGVFGGEESIGDIILTISLRIMGFLWKTTVFLAKREGKLFLGTSKYTTTFLKNA